MTNGRLYPQAEEFRKWEVPAHSGAPSEAFSTTATHTIVTNELRERPFAAIHADATGAINASSAVGREVMLAQFEGLASSANNEYRGDSCHSIGTRHETGLQAGGGVLMNQALLDRLVDAG